ncbi:MAG: hypothetical protein R3F43_32175, partial [bacterium]
DAAPMPGSLPIIVDDHFAPSGFMGDGETGGISASNDCARRGADAAGLCHRFAYTPGAAGWAGVWWQSPDGNWGASPGFAMPAGATRVQFQAWSAAPATVTVFAGYGAADGFNVEAELSLTTSPTTYTLDLAGVPYADIAGGFGWVAQGADGPLELYLDDIRYVRDASDAIDPCTVACATVRGIECEGVPGYGACRQVCEGRRAGSCAAEADAWLGCVGDGGWACVGDAPAPTNGCAAQSDALAACEGAAPGASLPFFIDEHFVMSGYMGGGDVEVADCPEDVGGGTCRQITWTPNGAPWAGFFFQYPENNWGDLPGLALAPGATHARFRAWGAVGGERANFAVGIADADGFSVETGYAPLSPEARDYAIVLPEGIVELTGGFAWFLESADGSPITFFLDDVELRADAPPGGGGDGCTDPAAANHDPDAEADDGSCVYDVTFRVDMGCTAEPFEQVQITGPFCSWCADGFPLADDDGDGIWEGSYPFPAGLLEYKYMVDGFASQENLIDDVQAGQGQCAPVTDGAGFANRQFEVVGPTLRDETYGQCGACGEAPAPARRPVPDPHLRRPRPRLHPHRLRRRRDAAVVVDPASGPSQVVRVTRTPWPSSRPAPPPPAPWTASARIPLDAQNTRMTVRIWSPDAGIQIRLKVETAGNPAVSSRPRPPFVITPGPHLRLRRQARHRRPRPAATYNKLRFFFNFGVEGAAVGARTYYLDDVAFLGGTGEEPPPRPRPGSRPHLRRPRPGLRPHRLRRRRSSPPSSSTPPAAQPGRPRHQGRHGPALGRHHPRHRPHGQRRRIPLDAQNTRMTVRIWSPDAGIEIRLKVETAGNPAVSVETEAATPSPTPGRSHLRLRPPGPSAAAPRPRRHHNKLSIFFNFGVEGAAVGARTYYLDDVAFLGGTGEPRPATPTSSRPSPSTTPTSSTPSSASAAPRTPPSSSTRRRPQPGRPRVTKDAMAGYEAYGTTLATGPMDSVDASPSTPRTPA